MPERSPLPYAPLIPETLDAGDKTVYIVSDLHLGWRASWPYPPETSNPFGEDHVCNESAAAEFLASLRPEAANTILILNGDLPDLERCDPAGCLAYAADWAETHLQPLQEAGAEIWWIFGNHDYTLWMLVAQDARDPNQAQAALERGLHAKLAYPRIDVESGGTKFCVTHGDLLDLGMAFHKLGTPPESFASSGWRWLSRWSRLALGNVFRRADWHTALDYNRWILTVEEAGSVQELQAFYKQPPWVVSKLFAEFLTSGFAQGFLTHRGLRALVRLALMLELASWLTRVLNRWCRNRPAQQQRWWAMAAWGTSLFAVLLGVPLLAAVCWRMVVDPAACWLSTSVWFTPLAVLGCFGYLALGYYHTKAWAVWFWWLAWTHFGLAAAVTFHHCWALVQHSVGWWPMLALWGWYVLVVWLLLATAGMLKSERFAATVWLHAIDQKWRNLQYAVDGGWLGDVTADNFDHFVVGHFHDPERRAELTDEGGWVGRHGFLLRDGSKQGFPLASYVRLHQGQVELFNFISGSAQPMTFVRDADPLYAECGGYWQCPANAGGAGGA